MKKIITTVVLLVAAIATTHAQGPGPESPESQKRAKTISLGPVVGFGHSGLQNVGYTDRFHPSINAGVTMNWSGMENIGFSADLLYSREGGSWDMNNGNDVDLHLTYIRLPLKFAYFFGDVENAFRPKVTIGPSLGFLIDEDLDIEGDTGSPYGVRSNFNERNNSFDIGGQGSLGFNWRMMERVWLNVDAYYYQGLRDIGDLNNYNANFGLRAGVAFGL